MEYTYLNFDELPDPSHRPMYLAGVKQFLRDVPAHGRVLDAGCGGGDFSIGLNEAGFDVFGCDLNASAVEVAQKRGFGRFEVASLYKPLAEPFGLQNFDAVVSIEVIEHLYSPLTFVRNCHEALVPGGVLVVSTPYWGWLKNCVLAVTGRMDRALTVLWEGGHIKHYSRRTLTRLMTENGFEVHGFRGCGSGLRAHLPGLWSGMLMAFRKPL